MASFNRITIVGYLGSAPELRYTTDGTPVANFSVATTERKKGKSGEYKDVTTWFRVNCWRRDAENASQYLDKGSQVYVEGRLSLNEYTDRDGHSRSNLEVNATEIKYLSKAEGRSVAATSSGSPNTAPPSADEDDGLPF